ncbi:MAG: YgiQ family radical SAM protein [Lachnospiraceae bacterium]|nr:YgiQ family radical SAM protein [Lachnospiraceae bacterium]
MANGFMPVSKQDMQELNIDQLDFVYVSGDAYVDHPSFAVAIITRVLQAHGFTVGVIAQPDWKDDKSITVLGKPRLGFLVSAGNMDSMVNHYTVSKKHRDFDNYSPGGEMGHRPDYACVVYGNLIRRTYKDVPIILGGIEASLRRMAHYDYWSNKLKRSILLDSGADLISYGMGEKSVIAIAEALDSGIDISDITFIPGTVYKARNTDTVVDGIKLPTYEELLADKLNYAKSFNVQHNNTDPFTGKTMYEEYPHSVFVIQNPPQEPLSQMEMDDVYALPYTRKYHPMYESKGGIPALREVKFSLISNRGCFGGCNFCALTFHQGRIIQTRSQESIINEAKILIEDPEFKGYIHDVGGPTANFRKPSCKKQLKHGVCPNRQCLFPTPCKNLEVDHKEYISLLRKLRSLKGVKKVFIRSGIRFDYVLADNNDEFITELCRYHVSGQLKVAPEHISDEVLKYMGKPSVSVYNRFIDKYFKVNDKYDMKQYLVPYLMSSHPGSTLKEAVELAEYIRDLGYMPQQVQDFYPTPSTMSTCMYYTGVNPATLEPVYVTHNPHEKAMQRALIQYRNPENYDLVKEALLKAHREDLIGFDEKCLIPPRKLHSKNSNDRKKIKTGKTANTKKYTGNKSKSGDFDKNSRANAKDHYKKNSKSNNTSKGRNSNHGGSKPKNSRKR